MIDLETARETFLSFPEVSEEDHFGRPSYRVKKKIVATLQLDQKRAVVKLTPDQQLTYCENQAVFPVKGGWGKLGWTYLVLDIITPALFTEVATMAWCNVAPKKLVNQLVNSQNIP